MENINSSIHNYLKACCLGRNNAVKAKILAHRFNTTVREINNSIRELWKAEHLIGSAKRKPFGYYIPVTEIEKKNHLKAFKNEMFDMLVTFNRQKKAVKKSLEEKDYPYPLFPVAVHKSGQFEMVLS